MESAFLEAEHVRLAAEAWAFARDSVAPTAATEEEEGVAGDPLARRFIRRMAEAGLLSWVVPAAFGGPAAAAGARSARVDLRSLCVIREALAYASGLLRPHVRHASVGAGPVALFGDGAQQASYLPRVAAARRSQLSH